MSTRTRGACGEAMACAYLQRKGYTLLEKNYRAGRYEIDLIMRDGETLVFVEVKARRTNVAIPGRMAVDARKQAHILLAAQGYLQEKDAFESPMRFDVAEVDLTLGRVEHIIAAFP